MNRSTSARFAFLLASFLFMQSACMAQADKPQMDEELQQMVIEDQRERSSIRGKAWPAELTARDRTRRARTSELLKAGRLRTGVDFSNTALIFQHGESEDDYRMAYSLAWTAYSMLEEGVPKQFAGWLSAAAWDRLLLAKGKKQWYGTQYARDPVTHQRGVLLPFDETAVSQEEQERFKIRY